MSDYKKRLGAYGENLAADFLIRKGCQILDRNFRASSGEIDLIATSGDELLFVEVKTRSDSVSGYPELAVDWQKVKKISQTARRYMLSRRLDSFWRVDIVSIEINRTKKSAKIVWFKNVGAGN